jgi:cell division protein FtsB
VWWNGGRVLTIGLLCAIIGVASSVVLGHDGLRNLIALRAERQRLGEQAVALMEQNTSLRDQVKRLRSDDRFLESIARRELGLVRSDEIVYRFHRKAKPGAVR